MAVEITVSQRPETVRCTSCGHLVSGTAEDGSGLRAWNHRPNIAVKQRI